MLFWEVTGHGAASCQEAVKRRICERNWLCPQSWGHFSDKPRVHSLLPVQQLIGRSCSRGRWRRTGAWLQQRDWKHPTAPQNPQHPSTNQREGWGTLSSPATLRTGERICSSELGWTCSEDPVAAQRPWEPGGGCASGKGSAQATGEGSLLSSVSAQLHQTTDSTVIQGPKCLLEMISHSYPA